MRNLCRTICLSALLSVAAIASATTVEGNIGPGSKAPELSIKKWLKGEKIERLAPNKTYVVEFWATWCGPCIQAMPHVTELAKKNPDVIFLGVGIWEDDVDQVLEKFVEKMGDKIGYNLAYSGNQDGMAVTWMKAAEQNGIPSAFIVKNGVIQWIGHPMSLDKPLAEVKEGTFDLATFKKTFDEQAAVSRANRLVQSRFAAIEELHRSGKPKEAHQQLEDLVKEHPSFQRMADQIKFDWLAKEDFEKWKESAMAKAKGTEMDRQMLGSFSLRQAREGGHGQAAEIAIDLMIEHGQSDASAWMYPHFGMIYYKETKNYKKALDYANKLIAGVEEAMKAPDGDYLKEVLPSLKEEREKLIKLVEGMA